MEVLAIHQVPTKRLFTSREAQKYLGISEKTLQRLVSEGRLPEYRLRGWRTYKLEDLEAFVDDLEEAS